MKNLIAISILLTSLTASADFRTTAADTQSPLPTLTPVDISDTSVIYKRQVVLEGREAAVNVIGGEIPSDLFLSAKEAASSLTGEEFESNLDAAIAIIELSQE